MGDAEQQGGVAAFLEASAAMNRALWAWLKGHATIVLAVVGVAVVEAVRAILSRPKAVATPLPPLDLSTLATAQLKQAKDYDKIAEPLAVTIEAEHAALEEVTAKQTPEETASDAEVAKWLSDRLK